MIGTRGLHKCKCNQHIALIGNVQCLSGYATMDECFMFNETCTHIFLNFVVMDTNCMQKLRKIFIQVKDIKV